MHFPKVPGWTYKTSSGISFLELGYQEPSSNQDLGQALIELSKFLLICVFGHFDQMHCPKKSNIAICFRYICIIPRLNSLRHYCIRVLWIQTVDKVCIFWLTNQEYLDYQGKAGNRKLSCWACLIGIYSQQEVIYMSTLSEDQCRAGSFMPKWLFVESFR